MIAMMSCREVSELVSQGLDRKLGAGERFALGLHFGICRSCARFNRQLELLRLALQRLPDENAGPLEGVQST